MKEKKFDETKLQDFEESEDEDMRKREGKYIMMLTIIGTEEEAVAE